MHGYEKRRLGIVEVSFVIREPSQEGAQSHGRVDGPKCRIAEGVLLLHRAVEHRTKSVIESPQCQ
jgi:hypothetical protein